MNKNKIMLKELSVANIQKGQPYIILKNISCNFNSGKVYTILGKNGSGKSTLLKSVLKLLPPIDFKVEGEIEINGKNVYQMSETDLENFRKGIIKYVPQDAQTAFDPLKKTKYYFEKIYKINSGTAEMLDYFLLPPKDVLFRLHPHQLSGGMCQRLLISLSFLSRPEIIFFDEPTSALDTPVSNLLCRKIKEFAKEDKIAVIVTQDENFAKNVSDEIAVLSSGKISEFQAAGNFFNQERI